MSAPFSSRATFAWEPSANARGPGPLTLALDAGDHTEVSLSILRNLAYTTTTWWSVEVGKHVRSLL